MNQKDYSAENIPIEVLKYLEEVEVVWVTKLLHLQSDQCQYIRINVYSKLGK